MLKQLCVVLSLRGSGIASGHIFLKLFWKEMFYQLCEYEFTGSLALTLGRSRSGIKVLALGTGNLGEKLSLYTDSGSVNWSNSLVDNLIVSVTIKM